MARSAKPRVLVAMSGGVDSSVAAALLLRQGYEVIGCFMRLGSPGESLEDGLHPPQAPDHTHSNPTDPVRINRQGCCSINDAADARTVAAQLGISFYVLNFKRDFGRVIRYFVDEYNAGRTPNPCVQCNNWLKFGKLADYARSLDAPFVASGHYARLDTIDGEPALRCGVDADKDQSYVLFGIDRQAMQHTLLPIGAYHKTEIRELAQRFGLPVHAKPDSQEICFVPHDDYAQVVEQASDQPMQPGPLVDTDGRVIGEHAGHQRYTVGQRRGIGLAMGYPVYVVEKDPATNTVTLGPKNALARTELIATRCNWLIDPPARGRPFRCDVKIRYNAPAVPARVQAEPDNRMTVCFDQPVLAVAPGQAAVCYDGDRVLGGGWIHTAH